METVTLQPAREDKVVENQDNESRYETGVITTPNTEIKSFKTVTTIEITESKDSSELTDDIVILKTDPSTKRTVINKTAYAKLHRTLSPSRDNGTIENLKEKYETKKPDLINVQSQSVNTNKTEPIKTDGAIEPTYTSKRTSPVKLDEETVQTLKNKYSPANLGYPKTNRNSKLPVAKPRGAVKSQIILPSSKRPDRNKLRYSLDVGKKSKRKDENSNEVRRKNSSSSGEFISIITRSESEASVDKFEKELGLFTMDHKPKEKKRANSFRKIFSGRIFGKDKKKKEEEKQKVQYRENTTHSDNLQNENNSFNRQVTYRHTTGGTSNIKPNETKVTRSDSERFSQPKKVYITKEMEQKYAQMHINQFNQIKNTFENSESASQSKPNYVQSDQPVVKNNPGPISYTNLPSVNKYIDTSSSESTLESDKSNVYPGKEQTPRNELEQKSDSSNTMTSIKFGEIKDGSRDTPPRAQELQKQQSVRLVNPKALIPINTERSLPNPYQHSESSSTDVLQITHIENVEKAKNQTRPYFEETYGSVFDSLEPTREKNSGVLHRASPKVGDIKGNQKPPISPSLENTKLKLPPNREIIPLSPRIKSPIPHDGVSTEKIIATELLKPTRSPTPTRRSTNRLSSPSHQKLEIDIDYPDNITNERNEKHLENRRSISSKPPISKMTNRRSPETNSLGRQRISQHSPTLYTDNRNQTFPVAQSQENIYAKYRGGPMSPAMENQERITTNAMIHVNASKPRTPTPSNVLHNRSLSPVTPQSARSSTPVDVRMSPTAKTSPQKEDMRKSVEAYYWKEIKKLKEQENYDLYLYQMQMMPFGYAEDPGSIRRSRSLSPTSHRNSRRSLSLPREPRTPISLKDPTENPYGRMQPDSIPEGRAVVNQQTPHRSIIYGQVQEYPTNFRRNAPERRTIEDTPRNNHLYKPIFKRGSLTTPVQEFPDDIQNKKVSFSSSRADVQSLQSWPTKNGFTQSPPQRRIDNRRNTLEDDVFLPLTPRIPSSNENEGYGYVNKPQNTLYDFSNDSIYQRSKQNQEPAVYTTNPISIRYRQEYIQPQGGYVYEETADAYPQGVIRPGSVQMQEPLYVQRQIVPRRMSYDNAVLVGQRRIPEPQYVNRPQIPPPPQAQRDPRYGFKREIIVTDEIFGQFGGYIPQTSNEERYFQNRQIQNPVYSSRQSVAEPVYGRSGPKQVSVRDKVCDMYGQIHDRDSPSLSSPNQIKKTGIILGELQSSPGSPQVVRQSYSHLSNEHFARNSRLTASANDMYRRYQNTDPRYRSDSVYGGTRMPYQDYGGAPNRPLPPVPVVDKKVNLRNNSGRSDTESASDASEMQKISGAKNKKRSFFGK